MKDLPIRNIVLPATVVGASIFSVLTFTLPTFINRSAPDGLTQISGWLPSQGTLEDVHKEIVITYVGTAIVVSTSAGLGAAEWLRKRSQKSEPELDLKSVLTAFVDTHARQNNPDLEAHLAAVIANFPGNNSDWRQPALEIVGEANFTTTMETSYQFPQELPEGVWPSAQGTATTTSEPSTATAAHDTVMIFPAQYQRCRVQVPGSSEQQYAIEFDRQFYRLLSSSLTKELALATVQHLAEEQQAAIVTPMNQGYAVWVLEPDATLVAFAM